MFSKFVDFVDHQMAERSGLMLLILLGLLYKIIKTVFEMDWYYPDGELKNVVCQNEMLRNNFCAYISEYQWVGISDLYIILRNLLVLSPMALLSGFLICRAGADFGGVVIVEGTVCSGKTTWVSYVGKCAGITKILEHVHRPLLEMFVQDESVGFTLQMVMQEHRIRILEAIRSNYNAEGRAIVIDRSLVGDMAFAVWNYVIDSLSYDELQTYLKTSNEEVLYNLAKTVKSHQKAMQLVFIAVPTDVIHKRLLSRGDIDKNIAIDYYTGISIAHMIVMSWFLRKEKLRTAFNVYVVGTQQLDKKFLVQKVINAEQQSLSNPRFAPDIQDFTAALELREQQYHRLQRVCEILDVPFDWNDSAEQLPTDKYRISERYWYSVLRQVMRDCDDSDHTQ